MRRSILAGALGASCSVLACGPIKSGTLLVDAQAELSAASLAQGEKHAPFEYAAAEEYIHKAREEQSYAEFERAIIFATKSRDCARVARSKAELSMQKEMGDDEGRPVSPATCTPGPDRAAPMADPSLEKKLKLPGKKKARSAEPKDPTDAEPTSKGALPDGDAAEGQQGGGNKP